MYRGAAGGVAALHRVVTPGREASEVVIPIDGRRPVAEAWARVLRHYEQPGFGPATEAYLARHAQGARVVLAHRGSSAETAFGLGLRFEARATMDVVTALALVGRPEVRDEELAAFEGALAVNGPTWLELRRYVGGRDLVLGYRDIGAATG